MIESIVIQDPKIVSKNFSGKVDKHNPRGWRCFSVVIEKESLLEQLRANNWPIRVYYRKKFEEGETRESDKKYYIRVYVNYNYKKKPIIMVQGENGPRNLSESEIDKLDKFEFNVSNMVIRTKELENIKGEKRVLAFLKHCEIPSLLIS